uniref:Uncharacterized protein n=1 Tax=Cavia porcellus TaxID=10141 RepID=H0VF83_CAVPO
MMPGGLSEARPATREIQEMADKIQIGGQVCVHIKVFKPLPGQNEDALQLSGYQTGKSKDDDLTYF